MGGSGSPILPQAAKLKIKRQKAKGKRQKSVNPLFIGEKWAEMVFIGKEIIEMKGKKHGFRETPLIEKSFRILIFGFCLLPFDFRYRM